MEKNQFHQLYEILESKFHFYHQERFIEDDPIMIPHLFSNKEDIEIAGFLTAIISWGNRKIIIKKAKILMELMDMRPYDFVVNYSEKDLLRFQKFVHRTFQFEDLLFFITALRKIYKVHGGLEQAFTNSFIDIKHSIEQAGRYFIETPHLKRSEKHWPSPLKKSAAKKINMFLRWMVRKNSPVDFGLWNSVSPSLLMLPLDVHTGNVARRLGLLTRKQNDWQAVEEIMQVLRKMDSQDPVKYDYALFGMGIYEKFGK